MFVCIIGRMGNKANLGWQSRNIFFLFEPIFVSNYYVALKKRQCLGNSDVSFCPTSHIRILYLCVITTKSYVLFVNCYYDLLFVLQIDVRFLKRLTNGIVSCNVEGTMSFYFLTAICKKLNAV